MLIRLRTHRGVGKSWLEYLVEFTRRGEYQFPQLPLDGDVTDVEGATMELLRRMDGKYRMCLKPQSADLLAACKQSEVVIDGTLFRAYHVHIDTTQHPKADRVISGPPNAFWVCASELAGHEQTGAPEVFGHPVASWCRRAFEALPAKLRTRESPLALYHGTSAEAAPKIAAGGVKPSTVPGMLGPGVYIGKWDKAKSFATHTADQVARREAGAIVRCLLFPGNTLVMTSDMICTCGCGKAYVDHLAERSAGYTTVFVPDNSLPATRRAEWCVKAPSSHICCDGVFTLST